MYVSYDILKYGLKVRVKLSEWFLKLMSGKISVNLAYSVKLGLLPFSCNFSGNMTNTKFRLALFCYIHVSVLKKNTTYIIRTELESV